MRGKVQQDPRRRSCCRSSQSGAAGEEEANASHSLSSHQSREFFGLCVDVCGGRWAEVCKPAPCEDPLELHFASSSSPHEVQARAEELCAASTHRDRRRRE